MTASANQWHGNQLWTRRIARRSVNHGQTTFTCNGDYSLSGYMTYGGKQHHSVRDAISRCYHSTLR